jgi:hypothetical protein
MRVSAPAFALVATFFLQSVLAASQSSGEGQPPTERERAMLQRIHALEQHLADWK